VAEDGRADPEPLTKEDFEALARFRFAIRRYLRFSEETVRRRGVTPQQYQLLLALKGFPGREWATVRELAERLQLRHHSVVELVDRAQAQGLVDRAEHPEDARAVRVVPTGQGQRMLGELAALHRDELRRMNSALAPPVWHESATGGGDAPATGGGDEPGTGDGGDPVCLLHLTCPECGAMPSAEHPGQCWRCGREVG
jgi:DNA-binding MarR family transcriptional regulator